MFINFANKVKWPHVAVFKLLHKDCPTSSGTIYLNFVNKIYSTHTFVFTAIPAGR